MNSGEIFYTDSSGLELEKREFNNRFSYDLIVNLLNFL